MKHSRNIIIFIWFDISPTVEPNRTRRKTDKTVHLIFRHFSLLLLEKLVQTMVMIIIIIVAIHSVLNIETNKQSTRSISQVN